MQSILKEFAQNNIESEENYFHPNSEYDQAIRILTKNEDMLKNALSKDEQRLMVEFSDAHAHVSLLSDIDRFIQGYRLGVLMMIEVFTGHDPVKK